MVIIQLIMLNIKIINNYSTHFIKAIIQILLLATWWNNISFCEIESSCTYPAILLRRDLLGMIAISSHILLFVWKSKVRRG